LPSQEGPVNDGYTWYKALRVLYVTGPVLRLGKVFHKRSGKWRLYLVHIIACIHCMQIVCESSWLDWENKNNPCNLRHPIIFPPAKTSCPVEQFWWLNASQNPASVHTQSSRVKT
jgi:hypothetical protein